MQVAQSGRVQRLMGSPGELWICLDPDIAIGLRSMRSSKQQSLQPIPLPHLPGLWAGPWSGQPSGFEFLPQSSHPILSMQYLNLDLLVKLDIPSKCWETPKMQDQDASRIPAKWGPHKGPPRFASSTTIVGQGIWSIMRGGQGVGAGVQEIAQFWQGKARFYARSRLARQFK